jgi:hypothetical protein
MEGRRATAATEMLEIETVYLNGCGITSFFLLLFLADVWLVSACLLKLNQIRHWDWYTKIITPVINQLAKRGFSAAAEASFFRCVHKNLPNTNAEEQCHSTA